MSVLRDRHRIVLHPSDICGRPMTCTACGTLVDVIELPAPWLDPDHYVCGRCLQPVTAALANTPEPPAPPLTAADRVLAGTYDPHTEPIPY